MECSPQNAGHLLIDYFNTVDHLMAILELKDDELIFNLPNHSLADLLEVPTERLKCRAVEEFTDLDDNLKSWLTRGETDSVSPSVFTFECQLRDRNPEVWLECRIFQMPNRSDSTTVFYGFVAVDITKRKKAQEELGDVKDQIYDIIDLGNSDLGTTAESLQIIINEIPVMICCYDLSGNILFVNRAFEKIVGWSLTETRSIDLVAACYPDPDDRRRATEFMMSGRTDWEDFRLHRRNGDVLETSWSNVPVNRDIRIGIGIDITQRRQAEEAIRRLSRKTLEMLESDRQSVAKELHDSISANLAAIKFSLEGRVRTMGDPPANGQLSLETIIAHLADTIKESKRISNGLRPLTLDDLGLLPTLTAYIRKLKETYPDVEISQEIEIKETDLPDALKIVLYRVAQEALNNIHKHSRANRACFRLKRSGNAVKLEIEDNGSGFNLEAALERDDPFSGYGLRSMRERVEICDGSFEIRSEAGAGTSVVATIPLS